MKDCLFCQIVEKKINANIVYENDTLLVFRDINPQAPVHLLVIPKKHISSILEINEQDQELIGKIHLVIRRIMEKETKAVNGFRIICNSGPDAGQAVAHLHFHLLAGRKFSWPPG